jgi:hypothetical protein
MMVMAYSFFNINIGGENLRAKNKSNSKQEAGGAIERQETRAADAGDAESRPKAESGEHSEMRMRQNAFPEPHENELPHSTWHDHEQLWQMAREDDKLARMLEWKGASHQGATQPTAHTNNATDVSHASRGGD